MELKQPGVLQVASLWGWKVTYCFPKESTWTIFKTMDFLDTNMNQIYYQLPRRKVLTSISGLDILTSIGSSYLPHWSSCVFMTLWREPTSVSWYSGLTDSQLAEPRGFFWMELLSLIREWCLQVALATTAEERNCWYPDKEDWTHPQRTNSKQVHIPLCPINLSFPLPLVGSGLEGRLKHLRNLIKSGIWKF